jgi:hypothetical protein
MRWRNLAAALVPAVLVSSPAWPAEEGYKVDISQIEKEVEAKPYTFGGFVEFQPTLFVLDRDAAFYELRFQNRDEGPTVENYLMRLRLEGGYRWGIGSFRFRVDGFARNDFLGWDGDPVLMEGFFTLKPSQNLTVDLGKKPNKWGKGYAWNPVSFVDRPKNPEDPEEALEGLYVLTADLVKSFDGPLKTVAFTPVFMPVIREINDDFGQRGDLNIAAKLYLLLWDTDLDFMFLTGDSRTTRYGFDFAHNILSNFEVHGELAWINDAEIPSLERGRPLTIKHRDVLSGLLGFRYLTPTDLTLILEYYHNGPGFGRDDLENFVDLVNRAFEPKPLGPSPGPGGPSPTTAFQLPSADESPFSRPNPMQDYIYFRASQKEPFDILYFTPALTTIWNLNDKSFTLIPELLYSPITNLELRLRGAMLFGKSGTEYGEKPNDYRVEFRARYFF